MPKITQTIYQCVKILKTSIITTSCTSNNKLHNNIFNYFKIVFNNFKKVIYLRS